MPKAPEAANLIDNDIFIKNIASVNPIQHSNQIVGGMKWISVDTYTDQYADGTWSDGTTTKTKINFLAVQKYTPKQSKLIWDTLGKDEDKYGDAKKNIIFTKEGHLAFPTDATFSNASADTIFFNKLAIAGRNIKDNFNIYDTLDGIIDIDNFLFRDRTVCMFSPNLKWILYFSKNESTINSNDDSKSKPQYYLLYNPIHRKEFQKVYEALIKANPGDTSIRANLTDHVQAPGYETRYNLSTYSEIINKYCNAFILERGKLAGSTGGKWKHYGDPMCNIIMDSQVNGNIKEKDIGKLSKISDFQPNAQTHGRLTSILRMNITQKSLLEDYYGKPAGETKEFIQLEETARNTGTYYICGQDGKSMTTKSFGNFGQKPRVGILKYSGKTESFVQNFFNLRKNPRMVQDGLDTKDGNLAYETCRPITMNFTFCNINLTAGGDISINAEGGKDSKGVVIQNQCGAPPPPPATSVVDDPDDKVASQKTDEEVAQEIQRGNSGVIIKKNATNVVKGPKAYDPSSEIQEDEEETQAAILAAQAESDAAAAAAMAALNVGSSPPAADKNKMYMIIAAIVTILILLIAVYFLLF
jgi:hypothetical protein